MASAIQPAVGFLFTFVLGFAVAPLLRWLRGAMSVPSIGKGQLETWWQELRAHPEPSGTWVGILERIVLFWALYGPTWEAVGIWLVFKVAAKWEARNHIGFLPEQPDDNHSVPPLRWARARRIWAAQEYATFVVGTGANLLLAAAGVLIAKHGADVLKTLAAYR